MQPRLAHLGRHALRVLRHLGERHEGIGDLQARGVQLGLQLLQSPQVGAQRHEPEVGLVPEHRERHDLMVVGLTRLHRRRDRRRIRAGGRPAEEVQHPPPNRRHQRLSHAESLRAPPAYGRQRFTTAS